VTSAPLRENKYLPLRDNKNGGSLIFLTLADASFSVLLVASRRKPLILQAI
jgi:hypothetical protein